MTDRIYLKHDTNNTTTNIRTKLCLREINTKNNGVLLSIVIKTIQNGMDNSILTDTDVPSSPDQKAQEFIDDIGVEVVFEAVDNILYKNIDVDPYFMEIKRNSISIPEFKLLMTINYFITHIEDHYISKQLKTMFKDSNIWDDTNHNKEILIFDKYMDIIENWIIDVVREEMFIEAAAALASREITYPKKEKRYYKSYTELLEFLETIMDSNIRVYLEENILGGKTISDIFCEEFPDHLKVQIGDIFFIYENDIVRDGSTPNTKD